MERKPKNAKAKSIMPEYDLGLVPPQAVDLEEAMLGALMIERDAMLSVQGILRPESFYRDAHQTIYQVMVDLFTKNEPIDLYTVGKSLQKNGRLSEIGGPAYLAGLTQKVASASHIEYHATIIAQEYLRRQVIVMADEIRNMAFGSENLTDVFAHIENSVNAIYNSYAPDATQHISSAMGAAMKEAEKRAGDYLAGIMPGITTGIPDLDKMLYGGWGNSQLIVLGARPGMGKTALLLHLTKVAAGHGVPVAMFNLEMSSVQLANRLILSEVRMSSNDFRTGNISQDRWAELEHALPRLDCLPVYIDTRTSVSMSEIWRTARKLKRRGQCGMVVIDYLQLVKPDPELRKAIREQQVAEMSRTAKLMAKDLDVPVLLAAQLNRQSVSGGQIKPPTLSDLRESGAIEQDADIVAFIHRPEYYGLEEIQKGHQTLPSKGYGEIIVAKQRDGITGKAPFRYNENLTRITGFDYFGDEELAF